MPDPSQAPLVRLFPDPQVEVPLEGAFLAERLDLRSTPGRTFLYTNFVTSLDGRIAVGAEGKSPAGVPGALANERDWRLYQELAHQADVIVTSGRYLREYAEGRARGLLTPEWADELAAWRSHHGLPVKPALAVVSRKLDFDPAPAAELAGAVIGIGSASADPARVEALGAAGVSLILGASGDGVTGREIAEGLYRLGHRSGYSAAGPRIAHLLLADGVLDRLYVTSVARVMAGRSYVTLAEGPLLEAAPSAVPEAIYLDPAGAGGATQTFVVYRMEHEINRRPGGL